ncbi:hypothetical protein QTP70_000892, partial [Hemibagrus guttatus]
EEVKDKREKKTKWWKLKKEECCEEFRQKLRQALGGQVVLPDDWETTAEVIKETGRKVLGVSSGRRKEDKETWWWNEEVQDSVQRKRLAKKKWDMDRIKENRQEYKELQCRVKREVSKAKQKAYDELYTRSRNPSAGLKLSFLSSGGAFVTVSCVGLHDLEFADLGYGALDHQNVVDLSCTCEALVTLDLAFQITFSQLAVRVGCELEEKERFWSELDEVMESIPTGERVVIGADFNGHVGEGNRGDEESGVAEKYVRVVQDMYEMSRTVVRFAVGQTEDFKVEVGLHQGSALSPFLFAIVMDQLSEEVRQESPWTMIFADDIVIFSEIREQVEENLERWRFVLERRGMTVSSSRTDYMCVNEREGSGTVRLQGEEVKKVQEFKYLGSTVQSNGECGKEVKKRVQAGWNGWRKVTGVLCDRKISARIKGKVYRTVVRPTMLYGLETVSLRKRQCSELEVAELKMLRSFHNGCFTTNVSTGEAAITSSLRMDPAATTSGGLPLQNTSLPTDPVALREIIVQQGVLIRSYQDQVEALQSQLRSTSIGTPSQDLPAARGESPRLAMPEKYDGSADCCHGFLRQCEVFFSYQPGVYREEGTRCAFLLSLLMGKALDWASAVWDADPQIHSSFTYFAGMIREVFEYPAGGQGHFSPADGVTPGI